ncbi:prenyltransferase [Halosimplex rubrum]|uniref:Prenyltransferase n=1 Tax=Halosimplex rubrum TaxID=869889 RepID=A0A7D5T6I1_9EURY|nr:prenyltransferase [Halosimplex rubrum]QLH79490.1 prenyltransferase [Halosimplex rubrum]
MPDAMASLTARLGALAPPDTTVGYLLRLSRPRFWLYLAGPVMVGTVFAARTTAALFTPLTVALAAYFLLPANVFLYGVNDVFDADIDEENPKKADKEVRYRGSRAVVAAVLASGVLGVAILPVLPTEAVLAMLAFLALSVQYSAPPFRFKTTPVLDSLSNGLYVLPGVVAYATVAGAFPPALAVAGAWLWTMAMHTFSAVPDIEPDRAAGIETTATLLGERWTYAYCAVVWAAAAAVFWLVHPYWGGLLAVYPVFTAAVALTDVSVDRAYWWFPLLNTAVGTLLTMGGLWVIVDGA